MAPGPALGVETVQELERMLLPILIDRFGDGFNYGLLGKALIEVDAIYAGAIPGYLASDTPYHDLKHSLDTALAAARIADGMMGAGQSMTADELLLLVLGALFHDVGYIRCSSEKHLRGGALTRVHVGRGEKFFFRWLSLTPLHGHAEGGSAMLHYTGYEEPAAALDARLPAPYRRLGRIIGTADLISQLADRYYLERCRDALFEEFILAGSTAAASPEELLAGTPAFLDHVRRDRLERDLEGCYRYLERHFGCSPDPYSAAIERSAAFIRRIAGSREFHLLRRDTTQRVRYRPNVPRAIPAGAYSLAA